MSLRDHVGDLHKHTRTDEALMRAVALISVKLVCELPKTAPLSPVLVEISQ